MKCQMSGFMVADEVSKDRKTDTSQQDQAAHNGQCRIVGGNSLWQGWLAGEKFEPSVAKSRYCVEDCQPERWSSFRQCVLPMQPQEGSADGFNGQNDNNHLSGKFDNGASAQQAISISQCDAVNH